jgi:hypothetical protein
VDRPNKLFTGLFYLRADEDDSTGGKLEIPKSRKNHSHPLLHDYSISRRHCEVYRRVRYSANMAILFLNTAFSWHSVTKRRLTRHPRIFVNYVAQYKEPLYDIRQYQNRWNNYLDFPARQYRKFRRQWRYMKKPQAHQ